MEPSAREFLAPLRPDAVETQAWCDGAMPLRLAAYLSDATPPPSLVTSVRCVVRCGDEVLAMRNLDGHHVLPGGRREPEESYEETARREIREEAQLTVGGFQRLGAVQERLVAAALGG